MDFKQENKIEINLPLKVVELADNSYHRSVIIEQKIETMNEMRRSVDENGLTLG